jgi:KaiC/GvpD/RAD55 family RecA-like ATPase
VDQENEALGERVETGVPGFDELIGGGLIRNSTVLLKGACGTGKTIFGLRYLTFGASRGETGLLLSVEENRRDILRESAKFGWDLEALEKQDKLAIIERQTQYTLTISKLERIARQLGVKRIVIDSVPALFSSYPNELRPSEWRSAFHLLCQLLTGSCDSTAVLITETAWSQNVPYEEYVPKGVLELNYKMIEGIARKFLLVKKMREVRHSKRLHLYEITDRGFTIFTPRKAQTGGT